MKYKVLCKRFVDGDETVGGEIVGMLCSIHELLSSVYPICEAKTPAFIPGIHAGDETSLTRGTSCEILNICSRKPSE